MSQQNSGPEGAHKSTGFGISAGNPRPLHAQQFRFRPYPSASNTRNREGGRVVWKRRAKERRRRKGGAIWLVHSYAFQAVGDRAGPSRGLRVVGGSVSSVSERSHHVGALAIYHRQHRTS